MRAIQNRAFLLIDQAARNVYDFSFQARKLFQTLMISISQKRRFRRIETFCRPHMF